MDLMRRYPDKHFDLAIVDPPYGIMETFGSTCTGTIGRRKGDAPAAYKVGRWDACPPPPEYFTELRRVSQNQIVWGANHFIDRIPLPSPCWIVWDKRFSNDVSFAAVELAWTSFTSTAKRFEAHPMQPGRIHPTQKPVELYAWLLATYALSGQKILDTHLGSMSSAIACADFGCSLTGCEIDKDYFSSGIERLKQHLSQRDMFRPTVKLLSNDTIELDF